MAGDILLNIAQERRTIYNLGDDLQVTSKKDRLVNLLEQIFQTVPTPFNSQPTRVVVLLGPQHKNLWDIALAKLHEMIIDKDEWKRTETRIHDLKCAAGTVLFYDDSETIQGLQKRFPSCADNVPHWVTQANAMHQFLLWTVLAGEGIAANLQHYNGLIDDEVRRVWDIPAEWKMDAQLVFGTRLGTFPESKPKKPLGELIKIFGN